MPTTVPYSRTRLAALGRRPTVIRLPGAIFSIEGPGAVTCLQGLVTADVAGAAPDRSGYGAMLTAKGMIIADYRIGRVGGTCLLVGDPAARASTAAGLKRLLPPRLARATDRSDDWELLWVLGDPGPMTPEVHWPEPGRSARLGDDPEAGWMLGAPGAADPSIVVAGPAARVAALEAALVVAGAAAGDAADLRAARVLAGVPTLGADIDDRTLPQEAGFDALGGVSYSKGCYVGQETVARLHFRGRPNWLLRRIEAGPGVPLAETVPDAEGKPAIRPGTLLILEDGAVIGLARVRREIEPGATVGGITVVSPGPDKTTEPRS